ncbi:BON domain-containing protein [Kribbella shirazensis]|uniref:Osmotically-inducible protein OsmY n=1 Tax=Kribbella shirazensis TaxID=1105143 RepID=A0A7X6A589_9ACTN|nr:BON domain-containing protein [Kribbella shirazensis]NIK61713.1 osmotically-inducible protein OsmY [Kribbella shirazensis]
MRVTIDRGRNHGVRMRRPGRSLLAGAGLAAAGIGTGMLVEYLLDPDRGRARRARMRDQSAHTTHRMTDSLNGMSHDVANRSRGVAMGMRYRVAGRSADDAVLHDRVRAELGRHVSHPHALQVRVDAGVVTLTGDVLAAEEHSARRGVKRIPGVKGVHAQWTVHDEPGDVPTLQGKPTSRSKS